MREHEYEPIPGLPEQLPAGEYIVWQGRPDARAVARRVFYTWHLAVYFSLLIALHVVYRLMDGALLADILLDSAWQAGLAAIAMGVLTGVASLYAKGTIITFTNRRMVMRSGIAVPMIVNIPWCNVAGAGLHVHNDGTGDFLLTPSDDQRLYYFMLWPFVRPLGFRPVQPLLRGIREPEAVAQQLADIIRERHAKGETLRPAAVSATEDRGESHEQQPVPAV
ncbi:MAG: photosynthetic complex putative assembly protein PuhB [Halieaceae bacterium]|jgi:hypothetical protein|nr:photosynthetic complex putative assembly protein PuhB [Halieaceae bacterium]